MSARDDRMLGFGSQLEAWAEALTNALDRVEALLPRVCAGVDTGASGPELREALLFSLERAAWASIELGQAWVFERQLGVPRRPQDCFELLARAGWIGIDEARRLRQVSEHRTLSAREAGRVEWENLLEGIPLDVPLLRQWRVTTLGWRTRAP